MAGRRFSIPADLRTRAFACSSGELAWQEEDALLVVDAAEAAGIPILGGEVWFVGADGSISPSVPARDGTPGIMAWASVPARLETQDGFVARSAKESRRAIRLFHRAADVSPDPQGRAWFNLTFDDDAE